MSVESEVARQAMGFGAAMIAVLLVIGIIAYTVMSCRNRRKSEKSVRIIVDAKQKRVQRTSFNPSSDKHPGSRHEKFVIGLH